MRKVNSFTTIARQEMVPQTCAMPAPLNSSRRLVRTVLFTDIVESTPLVAELGDKKWKRLIDRHDGMIRREISRYKGEEVERTGDGFFATFEVPEQGIRCAWAVIDKVRDLGIEIRAGLHTGECELHKGNPRGLAVNIAARVMSKAGPGEVLVSSTVRDLATGSGIKFADQGSHTLKGVPGKWNLLSVLQVSAVKPGAKQPPRPKPRKRASDELSVMLVDDHPLWRNTLREIIEQKEVGTVVGEASDGEEAVSLAQSISPDVVVMDMNLPKLNGIETTRLIVANDARLKVLILASSDDSFDVLESVRAGASGYLLKTASAEQVAEAVTKVHKGELVFPAELANVVLGELRGDRGPSRREIRIVIGDDSVLSREGIEGLLTKSGFSVVASTGIEEVEEKITSLLPTMAIFDLGNRSMDTVIGLIERVMTKSSGLGVIVLSNEMTAANIKRLTSDGQRPVGYLLKNRVADLDEFADALVRISRGESVIDPEVAERLVADEETKSRIAGLTGREREVLSLMAEGRSNRAICERLFLSPKSVEAYVGSIFSKLGLEQTPDDQRRVLAVLAYLESSARGQD